MLRRVFLASVIAGLILLGFASEARDIQARLSLPTFLSDTAQIKAVGLTNPFGYGIADQGRYLRNPYSAGWDTIEQAMPPALSLEVRSSGFNTVRLVIDPAPLLFLDDENLSRLLKQIVDAVAYIVDARLKCIVDIHPAWDPSIPGYSGADLLDGPGSKFDALVFVESRLAAELGHRFSPQSVALELFNEPALARHLFAAGAWKGYLDRLYGAVRQTAPNLTLILSGDEYGSVESLTTLDPASYDLNTIYSFHDYHPMVFTHQAVEASAVGFGIRYVRGLKFPPDPGQRAAITSRALGALEIDQSRSAADRADIRKKLDNVLNAYFDMPQDGAWIRRRVLAGFRWAVRNGVSPSRIFWGEFGVWGELGSGNGADDSDRNAYLATIRHLAEDLGFGWGVWELTNPVTSWRIVTHSKDRRSLDPGVRSALFD